MAAPLTVPITPDAGRFAGATMATPCRHGYLTKLQVRRILDAGSFLTQEYGILLNTRIVIAHELSGAVGAKDGAALVADLVHELGMALQRWAPNSCPHLHYLYVHERWQENGYSTTVVAYIPDRLVDDAEAWLFDSFLAKRCAWPAAKGVMSMRTTQHDDAGARLRRHWQLMRLVCRSVDPMNKVRHQGERRALIDVLQIPARLRTTFIPLEIPQRRRVSQTIGVDEQKMASDRRLAPLSAFGDKAFDYLFTGWELSEHLDRLREKEERTKAQMQIDLKWPVRAGQRQDQVRAAAIDQLRASWPQDPRRRLRSWNGWWP